MAVLSVLRTISATRARTAAANKAAAVGSRDWPILLAFGCSAPSMRSHGAGCIREMASVGHKRMMVIKPSRFQWNAFKNNINFYFLLGFIPLTALVFYTHVFIGPAELAEIPEGYEPQPWEYHKYPIKRWFARYVYPSPQEDYEKYMHILKEEWDKKRLRLLERKVKASMKEEGDYQAWYHRPFTAKYVREFRRQTDWNAEHHSSGREG